MTAIRSKLDTFAALSRSLNPVARFRLGSQSLFNISFYSFGVSGVWVGFGSIILQFKATEIADSGSTIFGGLMLDKTSIAALISLIGLAIAAILQPLIGSMTDPKSANVKPIRYPFIVFGLFGLAASTLLLGFVQGFVALLIVIVAMQITGNSAQGPANALIIDHVAEDQRGRASGYLNLMRLAGAGCVSLIVVVLMTNYDAELAPQWMWYAVIVMSVVMLASAFYTLLALRIPTSPRIDVAAVPQINEPLPDDDADLVDLPTSSNRGRYYLVLVAMVFAIAALTATQTNALFYLQDVVGLENPAGGGAVVLASIVGTAAIIVYPAGKLSDRIGRGSLLLASGVLGAIGAGYLMVIGTSSLAAVVPGVVMIGLSVGIYLSVGWAVANDLVDRSAAARDLGLTSLAGLVGAVLGRSSGFIIGDLNERGIEFGIDHLGYAILLGSSGLAFLISGIAFWFIVARK